jgi:hypothetical protein
MRLHLGCIHIHHIFQIGGQSKLQYSNVMQYNLKTPIIIHGSTKHKKFVLLPDLACKIIISWPGINQRARGSAGEAPS